MAGLYLKICFWGMIPQLFYNIGTAVLRALGDTKSSLYYLLIASGVNLILDFVTIAGFGWGIAGAAWSTLISQWVSALLVAVKLCRLEPDYSLTLKNLRIYRKYLKATGTTGLPAGLQAVFMSISSLVIQTSINSFGPSAMAGMTVFSKVEGFLYFPLFSFGLAVTGFIGQNAGAGKYDRIRQGMRISLGIAVAASIVLSGIFLILANPMLRLFTSEEPVLQSGMEAILYIFPMYWLYAINQVYIGSIRGVGQTVYPMLTSLFSYCIFRVLWCTALLPVWHDMRVIYTSYDVSWILMVGLLYEGNRKYIFSKGKLKKCRNPAVSGVD